MSPNRRSEGEERFIRLQEHLHRTVDAVVNAARRAHAPDAVAACANAEHELALLQSLVHAMKIDGERKPLLRNDRVTYERISIA
jgi:hypothetical protein